MAGQVKFYRGTAGTSLPNTHQDGSIFIIERQNSTDGVYTLGDMYVDINEGKRLHIIPDSGFKFYTPSIANQISVLGEVYIVTDNNNEQIGVKIGDGLAYIGDLPQYSTMAVAVDKMNSWSNKVNAYLGTEYNNTVTATQRAIDGLNAPNDIETLVLSRELWF